MGESRNGRSREDSSLIQPEAEQIAIHPFLAIGDCVQEASKSLPRGVGVRGCAVTTFHNFFPGDSHYSRGRFASVLSNGSSMKPTLPDPAVLLVEPYEGRRIRRGDVVVFRLPDSSLTIAHRVVSISEKGLVTKGDANGAPDPWKPSADAIIGQVCFVCTPDGFRRIHGGRLGLLTAVALRSRRWSARVLVPVLRPLLAAAPLQRLASRLWLLLWRPKVVCFSHRGESSLLLLARGRMIGRFDPEPGEWRLNHPFAVFIDVNVLHRPRLPLP